MARPNSLAGGQWSPKDLLAHIAFWEELALEALDDWRAGRRPEMESITDGGPAATDLANLRNWERSVRDSLEQTSNRASSAHLRLLRSIRELTDDEWASTPPYPNPSMATLAELLGGITAAPDGPFRHAFAHLDELRAYAQSLQA